MTTGKKNLGSMIFEGGVEGVVIGFMHSLLEGVKTEGANYLKSKMFGLGTNDEHLFLSACSYALEKKMITKAGLLKVSEVIDSYESSQRNRIIGIIGKEETEVSEESDKLAADGTVITDKKTGKPLKVHYSTRANRKGAEMLAMLAKLNKTQIRQILESAGATHTLQSDLKKQVKTKVEAVQSSKLKNDGDNFFARETWLEKLAK